MAKASKKAAKSSPPASAGALRAKATQEDIWAHAIYLEARKKIVGPIMAFVGVLAALGLYTAFEFYRSLQTFATEQVTTTIDEGIKTQVQAMISYTVAGDEVAAKGALTIHGVTKDVELKGKLAAKGEGIQVTGQFDSLMNDWGIKPPVMMMGTVRVADKISIAYDYDLAK